MSNNQYNGLQQGHWRYGSDVNALSQSLLQKVDGEFLNSQINFLTISGVPIQGNDVPNKLYVDNASRIDDITLERVSQNNNIVTRVRPNISLQSLQITGAIALPNQVTSKAYVDQQISNVVSGGANSVSGGNAIAVNNNVVNVLSDTTTISRNLQNQLQLSDGAVTSSKISSQPLSLSNTTDASLSTLGGVQTRQLNATGNITSGTVLQGRALAVQEGTQNYTLQAVLQSLDTGLTLNNLTPLATQSRMNICSTVAGGALTPYTSQLMLYRQGFNTNPDQSRLILESTPTQFSLRTNQVGGVSPVPLEISNGSSMIRLQDNGRVEITNTRPDSLVVSGGVVISGVLTCGTGAFTGVVTGIDGASASSLVTKNYVDTRYGGGVGVTRNGFNFDVNPTQNQITSLGTLSSLSVSGNLSGNTASFSGAVTVASPTLGGHAATRGYVDNLVTTSGFNPANPLTLSSNSNTAFTLPNGRGVMRQLSVSGPAQGAGDSNGSLTVSGGISCDEFIRGLSLNIVSTQDSNSPSNGAVTIAGGMGVQRSLYVGGRDLVLGTPGTSTVSQLQLNTQVSGIANRIWLCNDPQSNRDFAIRDDSGGLGNILAWRRSTNILTLQNTSTNTLRITSTEDSTSLTTGSLVVTGGISTERSLFARDATLFGQSPVLNLSGNGGVNNSVSVFLNAWRGRTGGSSVILSGVDDGNSGGTFRISCATGTEVAQESVRVRRPEQSTSRTTGTMNITGGLGVSQRVTCQSLVLQDSDEVTRIRHYGQVFIGGSGGARNGTMVFNFPAMPNFSYKPFISIEAIGNPAVPLTFGHAISAKTLTSLTVSITVTGYAQTINSWSEDLYISLLLIS